MTMNRKRSRPITVDGEKFRFAVSCSTLANDHYQLNVTVQNEEGNGSYLLVRGLVTRDFWLDISTGIKDLDDYPILKPAHVVRLIQLSKKAGWNHKAAGKPFVLETSNEEIFQDALED